MKSKIAILALGLLLVTAISIGCGKLSIPTGDGGSISISKDGELTVKGKDGEGSVSISGDQKLPKGFPSDIPIPKGATIEGSLQAKSNGKNSYTVTLTAKQDIEELTELYEKYMDKEGYEETSGWGDQSFWSMTGFKDEYMFSAMISGDSQEGSSVILVYGPRD